MATSTAAEIARVRAMCASGRAQQIRIDVGLTRGDIARDVGVSLSTVRKWELGERMPTGTAAIRYLKLIRQLSEMSLAS